MAEEKKEHEKKEGKKKPHAGHGFLRSKHEYHADGSMTHHFEHESGPDRDVKHATADLDGMHDSLEDNLRPEGNPGEAEANAGQSGVEEAPGAPGGAPMPAGQ